MFFLKDNISCIAFWAFEAALALNETCLCFLCGAFFKKKKTTPKKPTLWQLNINATMCDWRKKTLPFDSGEMTPKPDIYYTYFQYTVLQIRWHIFDIILLYNWLFPMLDKACQQKANETEKRTASYIANSCIYQQ